MELAFVGSARLTLSYCREPRIRVWKAYLFPRWDAVVVGPLGRSGGTQDQRLFLCTTTNRPELVFTLAVGLLGRSWGLFIYPGKLRWMLSVGLLNIWAGFGKLATLLIISPSNRHSSFILMRLVKQLIFPRTRWGERPSSSSNILFQARSIHNLGKDYS